MCQILYVVRDTVDHAKQHEIRQPPYIQPDARDAVRNSSDFLSGVRSFTSYVTLLITPRNVTDNSHRFYGQVLVALYSTAFDLLSCARFYTSIDFLSGVRSFTSYVTLLITPRNVTDNSHRFYGQVLVALYSTAFDLLSCARFFTSSFTAYVTLLITPRNVTDNSHRFYGQVLVALYSTAFDLLSCARFFTSIDFLSGVRSFTSYVTLLITPRNVTDNSHRFYGQVLVALYSTAFDLLSCARFFTSCQILHSIRDAVDHAKKRDRQQSSFLRPGACGSVLNSICLVVMCQILYVVRDTVDHAKQHEIRQPPYIQPDARDAVRNSIDFLSGVRSFTSYVTLLITPSNVTDNSHRFYGQVLVALYSTAFDLLSCARFFTSCQILHSIRDAVDHAKKRDRQQSSFLRPGACGSVLNSI
ncbi:hypothetical protein GN958_ATG21850 [Phytophthora infestans]|uniref:Uncharacterized protein n=1 Tax=Phytophthora infestans TaxID=4787 RepID=A0A8S9TLU2_PHYIN|nr:hypothetical protein GN958_ATG21850 [Phytophthora infestans]